LNSYPHKDAGGRIVWWTVALTVAMTLALAVISQVLSPETVTRVFSETGAVEGGSILAWFALAVAIVVLLGPRTLSAWAGVVLCVFAAAREADWHKEFTGYSVLKPGFFLSSEHELTHQLIAAPIVALTAASVIFVCYRMFKRIRSLENPNVGWVWGLGFSIFVLVGSKLLDRAPAILRDDFGITVGEGILAAGLALEEGLELWLPGVFLGAVLSFAAWQRGISGDRAMRSD